ncbi:hypothetical protein M9H77_06137 [Catharanthus roseus]|uniref:Uncharacterized protein n=1 Tax=Catharanthus roseus TaxID=4058 RepID=A0ACC0BR87_CATRO|nr:hypothetical protein M9H77_06137 [Catharanthus roseus]
MLYGGKAALWRAKRDLKLRRLAGIGYEIPELGSDDLVMRSGLCPWGPIVALHVLLNSSIEAALMCLDSLRFPSCARNPHVGSNISVVKINLGWLEAQWHTTLIDGYTRMALLWAGSSGTALSSSYSLKEIVPERDPIAVIDLLDSESAEGLVAQEIGLGASIEEDPSEPKSDSEMIPEPAREAPMDVEGIGTFIAGGFPIAASSTPVLPAEFHDICGYFLWREQRVEAASQQIAELREEISRTDALFHTAYLPGAIILQNIPCCCTLDGTSENVYSFSLILLAGLQCDSLPPEIQTYPWFRKKKTSGAHSPDHENKTMPENSSHRPSDEGKPCGIRHPSEKSPPSTPQSAD